MSPSTSFNPSISGSCSNISSTIVKRGLLVYLVPSQSCIGFMHLYCINVATHKTYVSQSLSIQTSHLKGTVARDLLVAFHESKPFTNVVNECRERSDAGGHKEMSSILADQ